ncbi:MAG: hypothetical protein ABF785_06900 [Acetobacter papayae]|uniref:hypothetical protein n=1 Tax=Acetobacter papayae TaxID=1076592 RepID=UPI0039E86FB2
MHIHAPRFSFKALALFATGLCAFGGAVLPSSAAHAQASVLLKHQQTSAIVETVDREAREVLLREDNGHLITIEYGAGVSDLPHLHEGDHLRISFVETLGADMAPPGSPLPESTLTTARGFAHGHPRGVIAAFNRERATIQAIDLKTHSVSFVTDDNALHVAVLHTKAMQDFLATLKVGDVVDMTRMESISYVITNETVPAAAPQAAAPAPSVAPAPAPAPAAQ